MSGPDRPRVEEDEPEKESRLNKERDPQDMSRTLKAEVEDTCRSDEERDPQDMLQMFRIEADEIYESIREAHPQVTPDVMRGRDSSDLEEWPKSQIIDPDLEDRYINIVQNDTDVPNWNDRKLVEEQLNMRNNNQWRQWQFNAVTTDHNKSPEPTCQHPKKILVTQPEAPGPPHAFATEETFRASSKEPPRTRMKQPKKGDRSAVTAIAQAQPI